MAWKSAIGLAELDALLGVLDRRLVGALRAAERARRGVGARALEPARHAVERLAFLGAARLDHRHAHVVEVELPGLPAEVADLGDRASGHALGQLALGLLDRDRGEALVAASLAGLGARDHLDEVGAVGERAPVLAAVQDPVVAVALGAALDRREVGADVGLGHGERAEILAARHRLDLLLALVALARNRAVEAVAARDQAGDAHPAARELLGDQAVLEDPRARRRRTPRESRSRSSPCRPSSCAASRGMSPLTGSSSLATGRTSFIVKSRAMSRSICRSLVR